MMRDRQLPLSNLEKVGMAIAAHRIRRHEGDGRDIFRTHTRIPRLR